MGFLKRKVAQIKAKNKIKDEEKLKRFANKQQGKTTKKAARVAKRTRQSVRRTNARETKGKGRIGARLSKVLDKKGYGELDPSQVDTVNELQPYQPAMQDYLDERGIEYDEQDPIEVTARYTMANEEINDPLDDQTFDDAYVNDDDYYDGMEGYEHLDWKGEARGAIKAALGSVGNSALKYFGEVQDKKNKGQSLNKNEERILNAGNTVKGAVRGVVKDKANGLLLPVLGVAVVALLVMRK